ncbi:hypothetical protein H4R19_002216 [Coemansia spiralis]|nr:hypothetical protein H4R19_002216 [Coemansia spiralis]
MLDVNSTQSKCPLLHYAVLPASIEAIHISMNAAAYESIADVMLPTSKRLMLGVKSLSEDPSRGFAAINGLLKRVRRCEVVKLLVSDRTRPVPLENITCTTLMHLAISGPTSVDSMLSFIERMPNLAKLVFDRLDTHNIQSDVSIPGADENAVIEPLSTLLRLLAIDYHRDGYSPDMAVAVAKHVLLRIPTLAELLIAQTPKEPVLGFVEAYAPRYPRLRSVEFNICEGEATMEFQRSAYRHH